MFVDEVRAARRYEALDWIGEASHPLFAIASQAEGCRNDQLEVGCQQRKPQRN